MNWLRETEEAEQVLKRMYQSLHPDQGRERELIEKLFTDLKDRQVVCEAALQTRDAFSGLKEEKVELVEREKRLLPRYTRWCQETSWDRSDEHTEILESHQSLDTLITRFLEKWDPLAQAVESVRQDLKELNRYLEGLPEHLEAMDTPLRLQQFQWPTHLCERVTAATEVASKHIRRLNRLLTKIDKKFEILEIVCNGQAPKRWNSRTGSDAETEEFSEDDDDS